ncbi:hypothetical protein Phum_PHUM308470 [Pediculus humanus corporis]|uniref:Glutathione peroxidase n=1 Tax=Pediculus humanus subsp. corporis TaxID=121224 RepID=E0VME2_PEDHC|nr:uncharacterized protein Phum_PHUM308470 [Pediculus humanus corporis]EEB14548.1 hypothetical protein Phum_PHUM308470 [Pediculus humanus corporis]
MDANILASLLLTLTTFVTFSKGAGEINRIPARPCFQHAQPGDTIYKYNLTDIYGTDNISLSEFEGKVVLVVNVATY